ncbi:MAG: ABC transporter ATP-binding protein [Actinomycetaceae bacterium]|nr:ABC transporter ATP-binding protein [Actinomycetaceae bacterium]
MNIFQCKEITFSYRDGEIDTPLLDDLDFTIPQGITMGIIGPNGSGKSTLLKCLYKSLQPKTGDIYFLEQPLADFSTKNLAKHLAVVIQAEQTALPLTIREYIQLGRAVYKKMFSGYSDSDKNLVEETIQLLGLQNLAEKAITEVSGGEHQRAMLARALVQSTPILLLDEPTNHLDVFYQHQILQIVRKRKLSTVTVLHDLNLAARYCDQIAILNQGKIAAVGTPQEVLIPEILETIYRVKVKRIDDEDGIQLLMLPK